MSSQSLQEPFSFRKTGRYQCPVDEKGREYNEPAGLGTAFCGYQLNGPVGEPLPNLFRQLLHGMDGETALVYHNGETRHAVTLEETGRLFCEGHDRRSVCDQGFIHRDLG